ncbi:hypothetical protein MBLNU457_4668t1 [Dothideomycetes sp. NU457]
MDRSWFSSTFQDSRRDKSPHDQRRPRWQTPSPIRARMIPPPIVNSIYAPSSETKGRTSQSPELTRQSWHQRRQKQIEADLQLLLDAQSEGLIAGLEGESVAEGGALLENSTLTVRSHCLSSPSPSSNGPPKKMDLLRARRGLYVKIRQLAMLKAEERTGLDEEVEQCTATVNQLRSWDERRVVLQDRRTKLQEGQHQQKAREIREEANHMQQEIDDIEARLAKMKRLQSQLRKNADMVENSLQAKMSTCERDLADLEREIKDFEPESGPSQLNSINDTSGSDRTGIHPVQKKKLEQALDIWSAKRDAVLESQAQMQTETEALEEGAVVWKDVVKEVTQFERGLREDMADLNSHDSGRENAQSHMRNILAKMDQAIMSFESKYKLAETRNWKLLIAAIGAELHAFQKGKQVLEAALDMSNPELFQDGNGEAEPEASSVMTARAAEEHDQGDEIHGLDDAFEANRSPRHVSDTDTEDDGPDPNLLLSHQDTDTDE